MNTHELTKRLFTPHPAAPEDGRTPDGLLKQIGRARGDAPQNAQYRLALRATPLDAALTNGADKQPLTQRTLMTRIFCGIVIAVTGTVMGFTIGGGRLVNLIHPAEIFVIVAILFGGWITAFGFARPFGMLFDALLERSGSMERTQVNIKICESGSHLAIAGGIAAALLGLVITFGSISDVDVASVWWKFSAALTGTVIGLLVSLLVFQPLKFYFQKQEIETGNSPSQKSSTRPPALQQS